MTKCEPVEHEVVPGAQPPQLNSPGSTVPRGSRGGRGGDPRQEGEAQHRERGARRSVRVACFRGLRTCFMVVTRARGRGGASQGLDVKGVTLPTATQAGRRLPESGMAQAVEDAGPWGFCATFAPLQVGGVEKAC